MLVSMKGCCSNLQSKNLRLVVLLGDCNIEYFTRPSNKSLVGNVLFITEKPTTNG